MSARQKRYEAHRSGRVMVGAAVLGDMQKRPSTRPQLGIMRLREIEKIIRARYGRIIPEMDDDSIFRAVAISGTSQDLASWCRSWAPWALERADELLQPSIEEAATRRRMLKADAVADLLRVTLSERDSLGLKTIGSFDVPKAARSRMAKQRKRERDRARQSANRKAGGQRTRSEWLAESLTSARPWEALGISRRTWERRRDAGPSRVEEKEWKGDGPASHDEPDRSLRSRPSAASSLRSSADPFAEAGPASSSFSDRKKRTTSTNSARRKAGRTGGPGSEASESVAIPADHARSAP